jgi:hypothetical protein
MNGQFNGISLNSYLKKERFSRFVRPPQTSLNTNPISVLINLLINIIIVINIFFRSSSTTIILDDSRTTNNFFFIIIFILFFLRTSSGTVVGK